MDFNLDEDITDLAALAREIFDDLADTDRVRSPDMWEAHV